MFRHADFDNWGMRIIKRRIASLFVLILVVGLVLLFMRWNDYREKDLVEVLDTEEIVEFRYLDGTEEHVPLEFNGIVKDQESLQELMNFFSQYTVKKNKKRQDSSEYPDEFFAFQINYSDDRPSIPSWFERDLLFFNGNYYTVTNRPMDHVWLKNYFEVQN